MFFDWLSIYQDHPSALRLPVLTPTFELVIDTETGEAIGDKQPSYKYVGSHSTSLQIRISGNRVTVKGNPSRVNRLDNLFGFTDLDDCVTVYNRILLSLGLPPFTRCTKVFHHQGEDGKKVQTSSDGAVITEVHITENRTVGPENVAAYLAGLSTQRFRNSIPRLHSNGTTVDWLSKLGNARLIYPSVYEKSNEIDLHLLPRLKRLHGVDSVEYQQAEKVRDYCLENGVVRFEQKIKSEFLRRQNLNYWGLFDQSEFKPINNELLKIDKKFKVDAMDYQTVAQQLVDEGICKTLLSANSTAGYFFMWMHGQYFDLGKRSVQTHRARLRRLGIDIAEKCDVSKHNPIRVIEVRQIEVGSLSIPDWYELPAVNHLKLVA